MEAFDWAAAKENRSPGMYQFLKATHNKPIGVEDFIVMYASVPKVPGKGSRGASRARKEYAYLKEHFGFFGGAE